MYAPAQPFADHKKHKCLFELQINGTKNNTKGAGMDFQPLLGIPTNASLNIFFTCLSAEVEE